MNDLRLSCVKASKKLIVFVVNMEMTSPIWLRPKALVKPLRLLKHCLISTAVPSLRLHVQKFALNSYRKI